MMMVLRRIAEDDRCYRIEPVRERWNGALVDLPAELITRYEVAQAEWYAVQRELSERYDERCAHEARRRERFRVKSEWEINRAQFRADAIAQALANRAAEGPG